MNAHGRRAGAALFGLTVLAGILRVIGLDQPLWYDEIVTLVESVRPPLGEVLTRPTNVNNHPLYTVATHLSVAALGEQAWTIRLPAVVFGVASVPLVYLLGSMMLTRTQALGAAALLATSYHHIWFSQNARGYSMLAAWSLAATWMLLRGLAADGEATQVLGRRGSAASAARGEGPAAATQDLYQRRLGVGQAWWVGYALTLALGLYTHLTMVFVAAAHGLISAAGLVASPRGRATRAWRAALFAVVLGFVLALVAYAPMAAALIASVTTSAADATEVAGPRWAVMEALRSLRVGLGLPALILTVALAGRGAWLLLARRGWLTAALLLVPAACATAGTLLLQWPVRPRFYFFSIGFAAILTARGLTGLAAGADRRRGVAGALLALLILASLVSLPAGYRVPKQDFGAALPFLTNQRRPGEPVVTAGPASYPYARYYGLDWPDVSGAADFNALRARGRRVWLVYTLPQHVPADLLGVVARDCPPARVFPGTVGGGDVIVCVAEPIAADP